MPVLAHAVVIACFCSCCVFSHVVVVLCSCLYCDRVSCLCRARACAVLVFVLCSLVFVLCSGRFRVVLVLSACSSHGCTYDVVVSCSSTCSRHTITPTPTHHHHARARVHTDCPIFQWLSILILLTSLLRSSLWIFWAINKKRKGKKYAEKAQNRARAHKQRRSNKKALKKTQDHKRSGVWFFNIISAVVLGFVVFANNNNMLYEIQYKFVIL